jgi:hypothetical protein
MKSFRTWYTNEFTCLPSEATGSASGFWHGLHYFLRVICPVVVDIGNIAVCFSDYGDLCGVVVSWHDVRDPSNTYLSLPSWWYEYLR